LRRGGEARRQRQKQHDKSFHLMLDRLARRDFVATVKRRAFAAGLRFNLGLEPAAKRTKTICN
jgi:hypothetical protein